MRVPLCIAFFSQSALFRYLSTGSNALECGDYFERLDYYDFAVWGTTLLKAAGFILRLQTGRSELLLP